MKKNIIKNKEGISSAKGTILMVPIIVILAAIVALTFHSDANTAPIKDDNEKNPNIQYFSSGRILITGNSTIEVEKIIASINKNNCYFETEGGVMYDPLKNNFYASGPIGSCGEKYK